MRALVFSGDLCVGRWRMPRNITSRVHFSGRYRWRRTRCFVHASAQHIRAFRASGPLGPHLPRSSPARPRSHPPQRWRRPQRAPRISWRCRLGTGDRRAALCPRRPRRRAPVVLAFRHGARGDAGRHRPRSAARFVSPAGRRRSTGWWGRTRVHPGGCPGGCSRRGVS
ncbi:hypothetical protein GALL_500820 [mine drainage metagenome]|uniref:Uncharacterized protein n=1 Tax=mine drainage metagenome TaxID=410659 RepID=A0A1J5PC56_9ZZZZ